tara:strand:+ start:608 stop:1720 length:1113 start_codon:yes stop_codon:yes gene_type:complete
MLKVIEQLKSGQHTLESLKDQLGIKHIEHPELPLVKLNYDQIESPKTHPLVRECRSLTLEKDTWKLVARSFPRFFNWGEVIDEQGDFNFDDFQVQSKEDGSLISVYWYRGEWHANTRGSFGLQEVQFTEYTWQDLVAQALKVKDLQAVESVLPKTLTYVFELATPYNKVVRTYPDSRMYLLTAFDHDGDEIGKDVNIDDIAKYINAHRPEVFSFTSIEQIQNYLDTMIKDDPTFEGVVIRDNENRRWKIKNPGYLSLHRMRGEGDNLYNPKHLLPWVLKGERSELITYFPEVADKFDEIDAQVQSELAKLIDIWHDAKGIETQKDFALAITKRTRFSSILFTVRKQNGNADDVVRMFRDANELIYKVLFK